MKPHQKRERLWLLESRERLKLQLEEVKTNMALLTDELEDAKRTAQEFMNIMQDYQDRQRDDSNFDPRTAIYDLYDDLCQLKDSTLIKTWNS